MNTNYREFAQEYSAWIAKNKIEITSLSSLEVDQAGLHPRLREYQKDVVIWSLRIGHGLIAAKFGLGKTTMQIEILRQVKAAVGGAQLVICPLGVRQQFTHEDGPQMGVTFRYVRNDAEAQAALDAGHMLITNYERVRDGGISEDWITANLTGVCMDEAAILGNLGTKTLEQFRRIFDGVQYKWAATATPAPNDYRQMIYFGDFFDEMDMGQALTRFFFRNPDKAADLQIMPHMEREFWMWVSSWALFIEKPSDIDSAYSDDGFSMPELEIIWHRLTSDHEKAWSVIDRDGQAFLLNDTTMGISNASVEKRSSMDNRITELMKVALQLNSEQTFSNRGEDENSKGTQQGILRSEQGAGEGAGIEVLPRKQRENRQGRQESIHGGIPENVQSAEVDAGGARGEESETQGAVRVRLGIQGEGKDASESMGGTEHAPETQQPFEVGIQYNAGGLQRPAGEAEWQMRDLRQGEHGNSGNGETGTLDACGSQSRNGRGEGIALRPMQLRDRAFQGQSADITSGGGLPRQFLIWCHLNEEQRKIEKALEEAGITASSVYGSLDIDESERRLFAWKNKEKQVFLAKPQQMGQGVNMQQCSVAIYVGLDFKFRDFIQSVHRIQRYGQKNKVTIHIIHTDAEDSVRDALERKWKMHDELMAKMRAIVAEFGLTRESLTNGLRRAIGVTRREKSGAGWQVFNNDTVLECYGMPDNSIDGIVTSIPFGNHYEYSANMNDFGYNQTDDVFWQQMDFLIPSLYRALKPGRMACIHVKDRLLYGHQTPHGLMEVDYFSDACNTAFRKHGFVSYGRITIPTDVVRENKSTNRLGWSENAKDSTKMGVGMPEYVLLFRKPQTDKTRSYGDEPVTKTKTGDGSYSRAAWQVDAHALWGSNGATVADFPPMLTQDEINGMDGSQLYNYWRHRMQKGTPYNHAEHVRFCEMIGDRLPATFMLAPVWMPEDEDQYVWTDILFMRTLNMQNARRRLAKHVCPFPLDIPRRLIVRYTNPGDVVLDPFSGLGTVGVVAIEEGRRYGGVELNQDYFDISAKYLTEAETIKNGRMSLFDISTIDRVKAEPDFFADVAHMPELAEAAD